VANAGGQADFLADSWLKAKSSHLSPRSLTIERLNLKHLNPFFGNRFLSDITPDDIAQYQAERCRAEDPLAVLSENSPESSNLQVDGLWGRRTRSIFTSGCKLDLITDLIILCSPRKKYGASGDAFTQCVYANDPHRPIGNWKEAWEGAKKRAGVQCRFHDLRHTGCTRMLEGGVPFPVVSDVMGWSPSTAIRMAKRYGHIGNAARREAVDKLSSSTENYSEGAQKWAQFSGVNPSVETV